MEELTPTQRLLLRLRDERCGGNAAELARRIKKDASYVNRLFYPADKAGAKGIGLEIMKACTEAFNLPVGYWEGADRISWPFPRISLDRVLALSETDRAYVEGRLEQAIETCELATMSEDEQRRFDQLTKPLKKSRSSVKKAA